MAILIFVKMLYNILLSGILYSGGCPCNVKYVDFPLATQEYVAYCLHNSATKAAKL